jgi:hypothetical protein
MVGAQSRQSAKLFLQSSELGLPHPSPAGECALPPLLGGEGHTHWRERGVGESQFHEGTYTVVLCIHMYFVGWWYWYGTTELITKIYK